MSILEKARKDAERVIQPGRKQKKNQGPKVLRYRPGQVPDWAREEEEEPEASVVTQGDTKTRRDRRLERLQAQKPVSREEALQSRRERYAEVVVDEGVDGERDDNSESSEDGELDQTSAQRCLLSQRINLEEIVAKEEMDEEPATGPIEEESSSEYESYYSSDEEDGASAWGVAVIQPVFISKEERETLAERERLEKEAEELEQQKVMREEELKVETKEILKEELKKDFEAQNATKAGREDEADSDEDEAEEYELWKQRELARIRRDKKEKEEWKQEMAEIERRRKMTDDEIAAEDADKLDRGEKKQMRFMQRYYHKGAFFRDGGKYDISNKDDYVQNYLEPTGEDHFDKTSLPSVLQVKNFGKAGRTKYTHLVDQDTTFDEAYNQKFYQHLAPLPVVEWKQTKRMGGMGDINPGRK